MLHLLNILGPISIITFIGYVMGKSTLGLHSRTLSSIVILVATPALIFHTLTSMHVSSGSLEIMALAAAGCMALSGLLGLLLVWGTGASVSGYLPGLMLPNSGNMGLPLAILTFGDEGMKLGAAYFFVVAVIQHSVGVSIAAGTVSLSHLLRQPLIYSIFLVLAVTILELPVPQVVLKTTEMLGGMMVPAMLILLGNSLATLKVTDLKPAMAIAVGRLGLGVVSALIVIYALDLTGTVAGVTFILATMPTAIVTYVFAEQYHRNSNQVAGAVVVSTLLTFLSLPAIIWAALWFTKHSI
ncbi:AEC family transporter [Labrenzia sp. CE80]|uniref:AEC family transporter n=1 Tax=Labrenzia sp. CE80 TaxID=1788986 RepID=UPI00129BD2F2|nr:AEC family transporter [Labrenzia sp. CE80]